MCAGSNPLTIDSDFNASIPVFVHTTFPPPAASLFSDDMKLIDLFESVFSMSLQRIEVINASIPLPASMVFDTESVSIVFVSAVLDITDSHGEDGTTTHHTGLRY